MTTIIGIKLNNRLDTAKDVQSILTEYGCIIKTRLGLHTLKEDGCENNGLILLEVPIKYNSTEMIEKLQRISDIEVKSMAFNQV